MTYRENELFINQYKKDLFSDNYLFSITDKWDVYVNLIKNSPMEYNNKTLLIGNYGSGKTTSIYYRLRELIDDESEISKRSKNIYFGSWKYARDHKWWENKMFKAVKFDWSEFLLESKKSIDNSTKIKLPMQVDLWSILDHHVFIKKIDKSTFMCNESGIPIDIRSFFKINDLEKGKHKDIKLKHKNKCYEARLEREGSERGRTKILWYSDFRAVIYKELPKWIDKFNSNEKNEKTLSMRFVADEKDKDTYTIDFIDENVIDEDIASEILEESNPRIEGEIKYYYGKKYERNPENRKKAIEYHGVVCMGCGFDFEKVYGERGKGYIEIHHINPLSTFEKEQEVNPKTDLVPLCSNCHTMIHRRKNKILSIEELKKIILKNNN